MGNVPVGVSCFNYGSTDALQSYPFNSLINTLSATINGFQCKNNLSQYKDLYLKTISRDLISKSASYTPSLPDGPFYNFSSYVGTNANIFSTATNQGYDHKRIPRGSYEVDSIVVTHNVTAGGTNTSTISTNTADTWSIVVTVTVLEPLLATGFFLMPQEEDGAGGLLGTNNINLQITLDSSGRHLWSSSTGYITGITMNSISNASLYYKMTQPNAIETAKIPQVVLYPYKEYNYQLTSGGSTIGANTTGVVVNTNSFQFGRVPHKIYVVARKQRQSQNWSDSESFLVIQRASIQFGAGHTGLLASSTQRQLWLLSSENLGEGASQTWEEFSGQINVAGVAGTGSASVVPSTGSILCLRPSLNFQLDESTTEGSVGTFQFQIQLTLANYTSSAVAYEILVFYEDCGIVKASRGQTQSVLGVNDISLVLRTKESEEPISSKQESDEIGGSFHKMMKHGKKHHKRHMEHAGSLSGGSNSGGAMRHMNKLHRLACL